MNQSKKLTDGALMTVIYIILLSLAIFIPGILSFMIVVLPLPFIIYAYKYNWQYAFIMLGATILFTLFFITIISLPLTLLVGFGGIMIGTAMHHNLSAYETLGRGSLGFIAGLLFIYIFTQVFLNINIANSIEMVMDESLEMSRVMLQQIGITEITEEEMQPLRDQFLRITDLIPTGIAIAAIVLSFISQWLGYKYLNRIENRQLRFPPFRSLRFPVAIVWIYFVALLMMFIEFETSSAIYLVVNNVMTLVGMLLVVQGFSFMFFISHQKNWSKALPIVGLIVTLIFPIMLMNLVRILGIIDIGFNIRDHYLKDKK